VQLTTNQNENQQTKMKITKLTSSEARDVMPAECAMLAERGQFVMGAIQIPMPAADSWPSEHDLERESQALFGAVKLADCEAYDDNDETVTWLVVRC